jgi:hypothetical protein
VHCQTVSSSQLLADACLRFSPSFPATSIAELPDHTRSGCEKSPMHGWVDWLPSKTPCADGKHESVSSHFLPVKLLPLQPQQCHSEFFHFLSFAWSCARRMSAYRCLSSCVGQEALKSSWVQSTHSQRLESCFQSIPGVQIVACSTVRNSKALPKAAIGSDNPVCTTLPPVSIVPRIHSKSFESLPGRLGKQQHDCMQK